MTLLLHFFLHAAVFLHHLSRLRRFTGSSQSATCYCIFSLLILLPAVVQVEESHWRELLLERLGPMLSSQGVNFQLDVITDYGSDPLQVGNKLLEWWCSQLPLIMSPL
jgi:hypothetical protein